MKIIKLTQLNGPLFASQIVNHFVSHFANQNDKVHFDYLVMLDMAKMTRLDWQGGFFTPITFGYFLTRKPNKKPHEL
jgi:hypothetical protein